MSGEAVIFYLLAAATLGSSAVVVTSGNIVHSAAALVPAFLGVTGLYILLNAEFVAGIQVLIYAGAITVLVLFAIMLTERGTGLGARQRNEQAAVGAAVAAVMALMLILIAAHTPWAAPAAGAALPTYTPGAIGQSFLRQNIFVFEGTSIVLLVSLMGAIVIARRED